MSYFHAFFFQYCVQVWLARDADMISSGNVLTYPFSFSASHGQGETLIDSLPPCANVSLAGVMFKILANGKVFYLDFFLVKIVWNTFRKQSDVQEIKSYQEITTGAFYNL